MRRARDTMSARIANNSTNAGAPQQPWEKQPGGTPKPDESFPVYMNLPFSTRSIRAVAARLGKSCQLCQRWSVWHAWACRAESHDSEIQRIEHAEMVEMRRAAIKYHIETGQQLQQIAANKLNDPRFHKRVATGSVENLVPRLRLGTCMAETLFPECAKRLRNGVSEDEVPKRSLGTRLERLGFLQSRWRPPGMFFDTQMQEFR